MKTVTINGIEYTVKPAKAKDWFRLMKKNESDQDFQFAVMALCVVDKDGNQAFTEDDLGDLEMPDWQRIDRAVTRANRLDEDAEKN